MIFDIQRFSTHDGPGIRTVVFLKGCPLRCAWCENPESQSAAPELLYTAKDCVGCHLCVRADAAGAVEARDDGKIRVLREKVPSEALSGVCPAKALRVAGRRASVQEILAEVRKDRCFFDKSRGGLTISGGEPLAQIGLVEELARAALGEGIDVAVQSCLVAGPEALDRILDLPIQWLVDLKHTDPERFRDMAGGEISLVLSNMTRLAERTPDVTIRVPLIPGFNDDESSVRAIFEFARALPRPTGAPGTAGAARGSQARGPAGSIDAHNAAGARRVDLLPYHDFGAGKYAALGRHYPYPLGSRLEHGFPERCAKIGRSLGLDVSIGG